MLISYCGLFIKNCAILILFNGRSPLGFNTPPCGALPTGCVGMRSFDNKLRAGVCSH
jgi:hypothetical protein